MRDRRPMCKLLIVLAISFFGCSLSMAEMNHESSAESVLFERFETVLYAKANALSSSGAYDHMAKDDAEVVRFPFTELLEGLKSLGRNTSTEILKNSDAVLLGAKDFRPPAGLGGVHSQRCYIVILRSRSGFDFRKYFHQEPALSVAGAPAWNWSAKLGEFGEEDPRPSSFYATQIASSYLLVSNNLEDLQVTAKGLISSENPGRILAGIPDWELVRQHKVWGYRRYRYSGVVDREAAGMSFIPPGVEALIFFVDFEKKVGVIRLLSSDISEDTAAKISAGAKLPPLKPQGAGVWEARIPLAGDEESSDRLIQAMELFGFGAYV
jgi:hypothetical protein